VKDIYETMTGAVSCRACSSLEYVLLEIDLAYDFILLNISEGIPFNSARAKDII
jgi:hypothetical protein